MEQEYDLLIVADATASMSRYLVSLNDSLPQIISVSALTGCFSRIGLLAYRDYGDLDLLEWSGWLDPSADSDAKQPDLPAMARSLEAEGGGDYPEAVKTALAKAYQEMRPEATTIILMYTDAPPHAKGVGGTYSNGPREQKSLEKPDSYGGFGPLFLDWVSACKQLRSGEKKAQVFCLLEKSMNWESVSIYNYLSTMTRGTCFYLHNSKPESISQVTMGLLLGWMGVEKAEPSDVALPASLSRYITIEKIKEVQSEDDKKGGIFFPRSNRNPFETNKISSNITRTDMTHTNIQKFLPMKDQPVADFAKSWSSDPAYQALAVKHLRKIIKEDVSAITLNPVFGSLWRAVCRDRKHEARDELVGAFDLRIGQITDADERARLKAWLEESYDHTGEVLETINSVPESDRFPCVFLDPTISFSQAEIEESATDGEGIGRPINSFTRAELLEIGRSCDPRILRRLGCVLTRLTYIERREDMPEHIAKTSDEEVPKIPMALASREYQGRFWNILLHTILPGTLLSARPASLLAALSLRLGISPLTQAAEHQMISFRGKWSDTEIPENWTVSCLSLLLDANRAYCQKEEHRISELDDKKAGGKPLALLRDCDRTLFESLCTFKMLELNLESSLTARIGWTPTKTMASIGPLVSCRSCKYPRSVTIMGKNRKCGLCFVEELEPSEKTRKSVHSRVSIEDKESTQATWVECSMRTCRAQYVVYNVDDLNVRAKCHYCRENESSAPWVECKKCLNRIIWPKEYRPSSLDTSGYTCPACSSGLETVVDTETNAKKISEGNSLSWLICNSKDPNTDPFTDRSLYYTISTIGTDTFSHFKFFPPIEDPLTLGGKTIRNTPELISHLQNLISNRQTERTTCSLCFSTFRKDAVNPACGRRGCFQRICNECLSGWYGLNNAGRMINTAALSCPFCRRFPSPRTLSKYGMGIHAVRDLAEVTRNQGTWIYAWCRNCHTAKPYVERVCARGMPAEIRDWGCDECRERERWEMRGVEQALARARAVERAEAPRMETEDRVSKMRECPGCGTMTERISGCGHITCPVEGCKTDWCYFCGEKGTADDIYTHMESAHGGLYGDMGDDFESDEEDYY